MPRYAVTLKAEMGITADSEEEAVSRCNDDAREFVAQNDGLEVAEVHEVDAKDEELTHGLDDIRFEESEVVDPAGEDSVDWTMNGVYTVVVDAKDAAEAADLARKLPGRLAEREMRAEQEEAMPRYAVTLTAEMWITADDRAQAIANCNDDAREFLVQNEDLKVINVAEVDADEVGATESLDEVEFRESEVVKAARKGSSDWTMRGVYVVVVDAKDPEEAGKAARALPKTLAAAAASAPSI